MREGTVQEGIARQLVGREFAGGRFVSYEYRGGKVLMTAVCTQCNGPHSGISIANASHAANNPTVRLIPCQHCTFVIPTAKKETYEDVVRISEHSRTSTQQRIVAEYEHAVRTAASKTVKKAPVNAARVQANRAIRAAMWEQHERFLMTLADEYGTYVDAPRVLQHPDYLSWEQWQQLSDDARDKTNHDVDLYLQNHGPRQP